MRLSQFVPEGSVAARRGCNRFFSSSFFLCCVIRFLQQRRRRFVKGETVIRYSFYSSFSLQRNNPLVGIISFSTFSPWEIPAATKICPLLVFDVTEMEGDFFLKWAEWEKLTRSARCHFETSFAHRSSSLSSSSSVCEHSFQLFGYGIDRISLLRGLQIDRQKQRFAVSIVEPREHHFAQYSLHK